MQNKLHFNCEYVMDVMAYLCTYVHVFNFNKLIALVRWFSKAEKETVQETLTSCFAFWYVDRWNEMRKFIKLIPRRFRDYIT